MLAATIKLSLRASSWLPVLSNRFCMSVKASNPAQNAGNNLQIIISLYITQINGFHKDQNSTPFWIFSLLNFPRGISVILISNSSIAALEQNNVSNDFNKNEDMHGSNSLNKKRKTHLYVSTLKSIIMSSSS